MEYIVEWTGEYNTLHVIVGPVFDHDRDGVMDVNITQYV